MQQPPALKPRPEHRTLAQERGRSLLWPGFSQTARALCTSKGQGINGRQLPEYSTQLRSDRCSSSPWLRLVLTNHAIYHSEVQERFSHFGLESRCNGGDVAKSRSYHSHTSFSDTIVRYSKLPECCLRDRNFSAYTRFVSVPGHSNSTSRERHRLHQKPLCHFLE